MLFVLSSLHSRQALSQLPFVQHPEPPGVSITNARMNDLVVDAANNKWIAFGNYGIGMYDGSTWTVYHSLNSGMPGDSAICIGFDATGNAWIGTSMGAVYKSGNSFTVYNSFNSGLPENTITAVLCETGITWFGTFSGLVAFDGNAWTLYDTGNSGIANDSVTSLTRDLSGSLWIGTRNGLSKFQNGNWTNYTTSNSPLSRYILDVESDAYDRLWVTCGNISIYPQVNTSGVYIINGSVVADFNAAYLNNETTATYARNLNITKDASGSIHFQATLFGNTGMVRVSGGTFAHFQYWGLNPGVQSYGGHFRMDQTGTLWTVPRYRFYFYSLDFAGYVTPLGSITFNNHRTIDINDVNAGINVAGDMHWDLSNARHEVPKGSGKNSVFASALWIGGIDQNGMLHTAAQTYRQTGNDYWPGPIGSLSVPFDTTSCKQFDRIWKMNKWKIEEFKNEFLAGNVTNGTYEVPEEIVSWPAKGNGIVNDQLAPFADVNSDGLYDPMNGDYPLIKGDQMLFYVFNDSLNIHTETGGLNFGVEVQASVYAFRCQNIPDSNQVINWTTFYHYDIINRSTNDYDSVFAAIWCDSDLGNAMDDYIGCDTTRATGFTYNGDNNDETGMGYGLNPPMQNVKILRGMEAVPGDGVDNDLDGIIDEPGERTTMNHFMSYYSMNGTPQGNPVTAQQFYYYLHSVWANGQHLTYGNDGFDPFAPKTNFFYSGVPYSGTGWTESGSGNIPNDKRMMIGTGAFSLHAGDTATLDFAYVFTWDSLNPNGLTTSIARNMADLDRVQYWFDNGSFPSCEVYTTGYPQYADEYPDLYAYPNPAHDFLFLYTESEQLSGMPYQIFNLLGEELLSGIIQPGGIPVRSLPGASYIISISTPGGPVFARFIKM